MNPYDIKRLIREKEFTTTEFKTKFNNEAVETAGALANTKGGVILIGISDDGTIKGIQIGKETLKNWANQISQSTEPAIIPEIDHAIVEDKEIGVVIIKEFPIKPVSVKGKCFRRVGNSNRIMSPHEIAELHLASTGASFDAFPAQRVYMDDIDLKKVKEYMGKANLSGRRKIPARTNPLMVLEKLDLIKDKKPTLAALLLFGKAPQEKWLQSTVHCGRFKQETLIIDDKLIGGVISDQIEDVMGFIRKNTNVKLVITGKPRRDEVWDYPLDALREAITNAICHRDYADIADIQLKIHDDRLTVWSPGGLPFGMTIEELYNPNHGSRPRNKLIAQIFYDLELIEKYGSGIQRIIDACKKANLPFPVFEERFGGFLVIFKKDIYHEEYLIGLGLNKRQVKAVMYVKEKGKITNKEYQELTKVSKAMSTIDLRELVNHEIFRKRGATGRGTEYTLERANNGLNGLNKG